MLLVVGWVLLAIFFKASVHRPENIAPPCLGNKLISIAQQYQGTLNDHQNIVDVNHGLFIPHQVVINQLRPQT